MISQYQVQGSVIQMWPIMGAQRPLHGPKPAPNDIFNKKTTLSLDHTVKCETFIPPKLFGALIFCFVLCSA